MEEPLTISKEAPAQNSMNYSLLRDEGIKYIQRVAGKIWTDYNTHDPGITILDVLCYAITDLGYRTAYPIQDIIAVNPDDPNANDIKNFFTARKILHNKPVTINDYRKLMIDVEVSDPALADCQYAGVKNAWIEKAEAPEVEVYVDQSNSKLVYLPVTSGQEPLDLRILYNVLLEFDSCDAYGDLNDNKIVRDLTVLEFAPEPELEGLVIRVDVQFPRWDNTVIDWEDDESIKQGIIGIEISFINLVDNYSITYSITPANEVILFGSKNTVSGPQPIDGLNDIAVKINQFIFDGTAGMIVAYKQKIGKILQIVDAVRATLNANRNLCEDFVKFNALRIEEILVCADIELMADANVERTQATIYHKIARFLSPTVNFYTLDEMLTDCYAQFQYAIVSIDNRQNIFTINTSLDIPPPKDSIISITGSNNNDGQYTVLSARPNKDNETFTDVIVLEQIPSDILTEGEKLFTGDFSATKCRPTEKIFEGPKLSHGFIKDEELEKADRKKVIHVSDLIRIIMDVEGVLAVKSIQIANKPQDNEDGAIESKSVKWCLHLAFDQNYVPRLNTDDSRITFYKDQLPFKARQLEVEQIMEELEDQERKQKLHYPVMDIAPPRGEYKNIEEYYSILNEFPLVYSVGKEGLHPKSKNKPNEAQARQLKGYLMFFDQLLANYLSQLSHVKDLFSMNAGKDDFGDFIIGRTYYAQTLFSAPDADPLYTGMYVDKPGHEVALNDIVENADLFSARRNKFLDHLMARFAEQFTDYALLTYRLSGEKAPVELIEDKLAFLNAYPEISAERGKAFNYKESCQLWSIKNISGLEQRASMLLGIEDRKAASLQFSPRFKITGTAPNIVFTVENDVPENVLQSKVGYSTVDQAKEALEKTIANGVFREKYRTRTDDGTNYYFELTCDNEVLAESVRKDFTSEDPGGDADVAIDEVISLLRAEFLGNPESNRHNLACPLLNYFKYTVAIDMEPNPPTYTISYELYKNPFVFLSADKVLTGSLTGQGDAKSQVNILNINTAAKTFRAEGNIMENLVPGDFVIVDLSAGSDGTYTIASFALNGADTDIVVNESIASAAAPLGVLLYNQVTQNEMNLLAESKVSDVLWKLVACGVKQQNYTFDPSFTPFTSPYKFQICDFRGAVLGESVAFDFNNIVAAWIAGVTSGKVTVSDSPGNNGEYDVSSATASGPSVMVTVSPAPVSPVPGGQLSFSESYTITAINKTDKVFKIGVDLTGKLFQGDSITITGSASNDAIYTVVHVTFDGTNSAITVSEDIPSDVVQGRLNYTRSYPITKVAGNEFTVKGSLDDKAVQEMISLLKTKFFNHEGMHLVEHILLRPKVNEPLFVDANQDTLDETLPNNGALKFVKKHPLKSAVSATQTFVVEGNITADLPGGKKIEVKGTALVNNEYTVLSAVLNGTDTEITVDEAFIADIAASSPEGTLSYSFSKSITAIDSSSQKITINGNAASAMSVGDIVTVQGSHDGINNGRYMLLTATNVAGKTEIIIDKVEELVQDKLLSVNIDQECECALEDMYSCIAHVILPYWPGRFINNDFRKFLDKTLRLEAPAHAFLNICWVSCSQMAEFELNYKTWLIENARQTTDKLELSRSLGELIDSIEKLRNVYPTGTLHDCDEDENLENAIILDHSALGEI